MENYRFTTQHLPQLAQWVGFERLFGELDRLATETVKKIPNWPPYNIRKLDEDHYAIEFAVAGFGKNDIEITTKDGVLTVKGEITPDTNADYIYKGIAERSFERSLRLADTVVVKNASMVNGMLKIWLENIIPEENKPKKIDINDAETPDLKTVKSKKQLLQE